MDPDFLATEMLSELKAENERKDRQLARKDKHSFIERCIYIATIIIIVGFFLLYIYQYDYVSYETNEADGVYALIDSEGNVIASDLDEEALQRLMEGTDGYSTENNSQSAAQEELEGQNP